MITSLFNMMPTSFKNKLIRWLEENRAIVIVIFCLPASFLFDLSIRFQRWLKSCLCLVRSHDLEVKEIQRLVRARADLPQASRRRLVTARPNWLSLSTKFFPKSTCHRIPVNLDRILSVDKTANVLKVEPLVTVSQAIDYLLALNPPRSDQSACEDPRCYTLQVCLEIGEATLGGLALGVGMTTHSHKAGLFQESVVSYDVVLASGELIRATADNEHADIFHCLPWSHGSLGLLVALEVRIRPVHRFVRLVYQGLQVDDDKQDAESTAGWQLFGRELRKSCGIESSSDQIADFVELTVYSRQRAVLMTGFPVAASEIPSGATIYPCSRFYLPWFYRHAETVVFPPSSSSQQPNHHEEFVPLRDYLLRHNRSIFWVLEALIGFCNAAWFRYSLGWLCPPKPAFLKFSTTPGVRAYTVVRQVFQDIVLPLPRLEESLQLADRLFRVYPLLVYPCRVYDHSSAAAGCGLGGQLKPAREDNRFRVSARDEEEGNRSVCGGRCAQYGMYFDLGIYGVPQAVKDRRQDYDIVQSYLEIEKFIRDSGGYPFLYADIFLTEAEFEQTFDLEAYRRCRVKYDPDQAFPSLYEKVRPEIDVRRLAGVSPT